MENYKEIENLFSEDNKARIVLDIANKEIGWFELNSKGKITRSGEKIKRIDLDKNGMKVVRWEDGDTFQDCFVDLKSIALNKKPKITFNRNVYTELNYEILSIKSSNNKRTGFRQHR